MKYLSGVPFLIGSESLHYCYICPCWCPFVSHVLGPAAVKTQLVQLFKLY